MDRTRDSIERIHNVGDGDKVPSCRGEPCHFSNYGFQGNNVVLAVSKVMGRNDLLVQGEEGTEGIEGDEPVALY